MSVEKIEPRHLEEIAREEDGFNKDQIDLNNNTTAKIQNPLAGVPREQLMCDVDAFAVKHRLADISELLKRGALVAQDPINFEDVDGLQRDERESLRDEVEHKWRQPKAMYFTVILCSIGAAVQGWDQTGSNGANLSFPLEFGIAHNEWLIGLVNAGPYIASAFFGCWLSDPPQQPPRPTWYHLLLCRLLYFPGHRLRLHSDLAADVRMQTSSWNWYGL